MKKVLTIILLAFSFLATAQTQPPIVQGSKLYQFRNGVKVDSALFLPRKDTGVTDGTMRAPGMLQYRPQDSLLYWMKGNKMTPIASGAVDLSAYWDSLTTKANFPIDTVQTVELMEFYTGKALLMVVSDPQRGGIFKRNFSESFGNEITRYPNIFGDVWDRIFDPSRGISVDWAPLDPTGGSDASAAIKSVFALPYKKFVFGAGSRYRLDDSIRIANKDSLTVDFNGSTIYENVLHERTILFYGCNALTIKNANFDGVQNYTSFQTAPTIFKLYVGIDSCTNTIIDNIRSKNKQGTIGFRKAYKFSVSNINHTGFLDDTHKTNASFCPAIYVAHDGFDGAATGWNGYNIITNSHANNNGSVVLLGDDAQLYSISNIVGENLHDNGVYLSSALYAAVTGCIFRYVDGSGIKARGRGFSITGNVITNSGIGITATGNGSDSFFGTIPDDLGGNGYGTIISNNTIDSVTLKGITVEAQDGLRPHDITVSANTISHHINSSNYALQVSTTNAATITGNKIYGSTASTAIIINNTSGDSTQNLNFSNNTIHGCTGIGVTFTGVKNGIIEGNRFFDVTGNAMLFQSCRGNQVINNYSDGLSYNASAANSNTRNVFMLNRGSSATTDNANNAVLWNLPNTQQGITNRPWFTGSTAIAASIPYIALDTISSANWTRLSTFYSLNGLTAATQTFVAGSAGSDFAISSVTSTHTFNIPTQDGTKTRGLLASADWTTFNNKAPATGGTGYIQNQVAAPQTAGYYISGNSNARNYYARDNSYPGTDTNFVAALEGIDNVASVAYSLGDINATNIIRVQTEPLKANNVSINAFKNQDIGFAIDSFQAGTPYKIRMILKKYGHLYLRDIDNVDSATNNIYPAVPNPYKGNYIYGFNNNIFSRDTTGAIHTLSAGYVIPEHYGAKGDGVTDDGAAFQSAFNSGKPVYIGPKTYLVNTTVILPEGAYVFGQRGKSIIKTTANQVVFDVQGNYTTIKDLKFLGDGKATGKTVQRAISMITQRVKTLIDGCLFSQLGGMGVYMNSIGNYKGNIISNCIADTCYAGYFFDNQAEYNSLIGCFGYGNTYGVVNYGGNNSITDGSFSQNDTAIVMGFGTGNPGHCTITGVRINHNFGASLVARGVTIGHTINGSMFYDGKIIIDGCTGFKFVGCDFSVDSITVKNSSVGCFFTNNRIRGLDPVLNFDNTSQVYWENNYNEVTTNQAPINLVVSANTTLGPGNKNLYVSTGSAITLTLPPAANCAGKEYFIKKIANNLNTITIDPNAAETIDGFNTATIFPYLGYMRIISNGTGWLIMDNGSFANSIRTVTANTTLDADYSTTLVNNSGSVTISLPAAAGVAGRTYTIKKVSAASNDVIIDPNASETIDAATTKTLTLQYSSITIESNGSNWHVVSSHAAATTL